MTCFFWGIYNMYFFYIARHPDRWNIHRTQENVLKVLTHRGQMTHIPTHINISKLVDHWAGKKSFQCNDAESKGDRFADDILQFILFNENFRILNQI